MHATYESRTNSWEKEYHLRLIAAAPDLLSALQAMEDAFHKFCTEEQRGEQATALAETRAALAKVEV